MAGKAQPDTYSARIKQIFRYSFSEHVFTAKTPCNHNSKWQLCHGVRTSLPVFTLTSIHPPFQLAVLGSELTPSLPLTSRWGSPTEEFDGSGFAAHNALGCVACFFSSGFISRPRTLKEIIRSVLSNSACAVILSPLRPYSVGVAITSHNVIVMISARR